MQGIDGTSQRVVNFRASKFAPCFLGSAFGGAASDERHDQAWIEIATGFSDARDVIA